MRKWDPASSSIPHSFMFVGPGRGGSSVLFQCHSCYCSKSGGQKSINRGRTMRKTQEKVYNSRHRCLGLGGTAEHHSDGAAAPATGGPRRSSRGWRGRRPAAFSAARGRGLGIGMAEQQAPGVGVDGVRHQLFGVGQLHDVALVDDGDAVGDVPHDREVVGDEAGR